MATITYTFVDRCAGGGHYRCDVSVNGNSLGRFVYTTDEVRAPLSDIPQDVREAAALIVMKLHMQGKTRAQMVTEFQSGPVTVTI